jgi:hypothetical protein
MVSAHRGHACCHRGRLIFCAAEYSDQQRRRRIADRDVSNRGRSSAGRSASASMSSSSKSLIALRYGPIQPAKRFSAPVRLRGRGRIQRRSGTQQRARSSGASCGMFGGGMVPCTLRIAFPQASGFAPGSVTSTRSA